MRVVTRIKLETHGRDGAKLYVANGRSNTVSVIDTARNALIKDIPVGQTPWGVQILE